MLEVYHTHHSRTALGFYMAVVAGMVATLSETAEPGSLTAWTLATLALFVVALLVYRGFTRDRRRDERLPLWAWRFAALSAAHGVSWGGCAVLFFHSSLGAIAMVPLLFSVGFSVAASHAKVAIPLCAYATFGPALGLSALAVGRDGAPGHEFLAAFLVGLGLFGVAFTRRSHALLVETLRLNRENAALARTMGRAHEAAERASAAKSHFLTVLSHEVRTPLNAMMGMLELLSDGRMDARSRRQVGTLRGAAEHIRSMVDDILDFSRMEAGELALSPSVFDLGALVADTADLFREAAARKGIELEVEFQPGTNGYRFGDERRLRQVVVNLLDNAIKHMDLGKVRLSVACSGDEIGFTVADDGPGIPPERREAVFEPFIRGRAEQDGAGLGLAICRRLVRLMGGAIWIEDAASGSRFRFTVAMTPADPPPAGGPAQAPAREVPLFEGRVLVVEDSDLGREAIAAMVSHLGPRVDKAKDGERAVAKAARQRYDLVLMDFQLPGMNGGQALAEIRAVESDLGLSPVPVALVTASLSQKAEDLMSEGFAAVLTKPFDRSALMGLLSRHLPVARRLPPRPMQQPDLDRVHARCLEEFAELRGAVEAGDRDEVERLAHRLAGLAAVFSLAGVARHAAALEREADGAGDLAAILARIEEALAVERPQVPGAGDGGPRGETSPVRVLIADDHEVVREGLRMIVAGQDDFEVVAEAADGLDCIRTLVAAKPQLVLLDLAMPNMGGAEVIAEIRRRSPKTRIVVLTAATSPVLIRNAAAAGADALLHKEAPADELLRTLRAVMAGHRPPQPAPKVDAPALTRRERQVLHQIVEGRRTREIAAALGLSERTVEKHRASLARKLGTSTPAELARLAVQDGLVG